MGGPRNNRPATAARPAPEPGVCTPMRPSGGGGRVTQALVLVEHDPSPLKLEVLGVEAWPVSECAVGTHAHEYAHTQTCYLLAGRAVITPQQGEPVHVGEGDLVTFLAGSSCAWEIRTPVRKHCSPA